MAHNLLRNLHPPLSAYLFGLKGCRLSIGMKKLMQVQVVLLFFIVLIIPEAPLLAQEIKKEVVDTSITIDGKTVIVEQEVWKLNDDPGSFERTLKSYTLQDSAGNQLFSKVFPESRLREHGFSEEFHIRVSTLSTPAREALTVYHAAYPSAPGSGFDLQLFVWQNDVLVPLSNPFDIYGRFGEIKRNHEGSEITLSDSEIILMTQHIAYHFYVDIPVIINLDPFVDDSYRHALQKDPESGLDIIPTTADQRPSFMSDKQVEVVLYKSAIGTESVTVQVDRDCSIEIGPAYGVTTVKESERGAGVSFEIKRLKVVIDGKPGFVGEEEYRKLGLPAFG